MGSTDATLADVGDILTANEDAFVLLLGDDDTRRREALMTIMVATWGKGYERGIRRGVELLRDEVTRRVG